jgi:hypothetical protein
MHATCPAILIRLDFITRTILGVEGCRLTTTANSTYPQLPSILEDVLLSATWGRAMPWWQGFTYHGRTNIGTQNAKGRTNTQYVYFYTQHGKQYTLGAYSNIYSARCNIAQFILFGNCSTCFGWYHHPSSGAHTTVSTACGICHVVIAIYRYRGRVGTGLSVLWVAYATHSTLTMHGPMNVKLGA